MKALLPILTFLWPVLTFAQFSVGERTITFNDPSRNNRAIECEIYYPAASAGTNVPLASGSFPVIVFGHGFAMQVGAYPNFWNEYVPQGYIMVFPTTEGGTIFPPPNHGEFGADLQFLALQIQDENGNVNSPFHQSIAPRTAIMGHSMGGGATFIGSSNFSGVDCVIGLAPAETNPSAIAAATNVSAPVIIFSGSSDGVTPPDENHIPIYDAAGSNCKYFVSIENGSHCYFASNTLTCTLGELAPGSLDAEAQRLVTYAVLTPWLDYFLKDDCDAWDDFQSALNTETNLGTINAVCTNDSPIITDNGSVLESNPQSNYQWYLNGADIPGASQQSFNYTQSGVYQVATTNLGNCPTLSNEINIQITGVEEYRIDIAASDLRNVVLTTTHLLQNVTISWSDISGRVIDILDIGKVQANQPFSVTRPTQTGVHFLNLTSQKHQQTWRFVNVAGN